MILGNSGAIDRGPSATLDELFRRAGVRNPDGIALADAPDRESFTDGAPRTFTYAEADRLISAFAARLRGLGLLTDAVVAIQMPNTVDGVIALLGVLRAGMIAAPLPLLWREHDIIAGLRGTAAKAIVTCARAGSHSPVQSAMRAAAEVFPIRHVCCFGRNLPDGAAPLDDLFEEGAFDLAHAAARSGQAASHVAVITFDVTADGLAPTLRSHAQLIAGGLASFLEAGMAQDGALLSTIPPTSFAGIALGVVPWLLTGGMLALHQGCNPSELAAQCAKLNDATIILPGPALAPLSSAGVLGDSIKTIVALWRAPERLAAEAAWQGMELLVDIAAFGEIGLLAARRGPGGIPAPIPHGRVGAVNVMETARSKAGTLMLRGAMVPASTLPPGTEPADMAGFVDTGFPCRRDGDALTPTGPPASIGAIGGYRFSRRALEGLVAEAGAGATIMALPDGPLGERLAGAAADAQAARAALRARGANPLISEAFRPRGHANAA